MTETSLLGPSAVPRPQLRLDALLDPASGTVVRGPAGDTPGSWVGAPSVYRDPASGDFYLTYRRRKPRGTGSDRGYAGYIARGTDGVHFTDIWTMKKAELDSPSMERFCLRRAGERWLLYVSYVDPADNRWRIDVLTADAPDAFSPGSRAPVLTADSTGTEGVKDPYVLQAGPVWLMYVSYAAATPLTPQERATAHATADIYNTGATRFPTGLATSLDGIGYDWQGETFPVGEGWDRYQSRITGLFRASPGWTALYDGSSSKAENYEERCGLAYSLDLTHWLRLTPKGPVLASPHASGSVRYLDTVADGDGVRFYYEYAREDGSHDLRVTDPVPIG